MTTTQRYKDLKFWLFAGLTILLTGIMSYLHLQEFITVSIFQEIAGYPFGGEGTVPWYYQTAELYSKVSLTFGLGYLSAFIASICTTIKRNKKGLIIAFILLIVVEAVNLYVF
jgi:uncharacterized membrane protein